MSLSERIRPNSEAAPWVCEEVKELEAKLARAKRGEEVASRDFRLTLNSLNRAQTQLAAARAQLRGLAAAQKVIDEMVKEARVAREQVKSQGYTRMWWKGRFDGVVCAKAMLALADYPAMVNNAETIEEILSGRLEGSSK